MDDAILAVCESQADDYRKHNPNVEVVAHPDELERKNPVPKWQWILDTFGDVLYLDDDITEFRKLFAAKGESVKMTKDDTMAVIYQTHDCAADLGAYYWGFNTQPDPRNYHGHKPIELTGMVWGCGSGIRGDAPGCKLHWNPEIPVNDDFWMACLNAYHHRFAYFDRRFYFLTKATFSGEGGAANFRTIDYEKDAYLELKKCFGEAIGLKNDTARVKRKHQYQPALRLPF